ncbi:MAG: M28 family peptidase [Candidatus Zixiibacteriota bacterium]
MNRVLAFLVIFFVLPGITFADDLYKVVVSSQSQAQALRSSGADPLVQISDGYLVLADEDASYRLRNSALDVRLIAGDVTKETLALDGLWDDTNARRFKVLFERDGVRLLQVDGLSKAVAGGQYGLIEISNENLTIEYTPASANTFLDITWPDDLQGVIDSVNTDSLYSYVWALQSYPFRSVGTENNRLARNWIYNKFVEFGYDSVVVDTFTTYFYTCYNVVAYKIGTTYPDQHVVVGGHFDAVSASPGADDNASGTAGVLEMARVLKDVDVPMTFVFAAFDAEEVGLYGSDYYADRAVAENEQIAFMMNMDMIGYYQGIDLVDLYYGAEAGYALLWDELGQTYTGLSGRFLGTSTRSDHYPFQRNGYDVCFCIEWGFTENPNYHTSHDSIDYVNFDYATRIVQTSLATTYTVAHYPPPLRIVDFEEPGDGSSAVVNWLNVNSPAVDHLTIYFYPLGSPQLIDSVQVSPLDTMYQVTGLLDGTEHVFYIRAYDSEGRTSLGQYEAYFTPTSIPHAPTNLLALPLYDAIRVTWQHSDPELDFDGFMVFRDGEIAAVTDDTIFVDSSASLGADLHSYKVAAIDLDDNISDTLLMTASTTRAATLEEGRILAINRTVRHTLDYADESLTTDFLFEALQGYDFEYFSDTAATTDFYGPIQLGLLDMLDYEVLIVGAEAGRYDDIAVNPVFNGILDTLAYYASIGGKIIVFGRWGNKTVLDTVDYMANSYSYDNAYHDMFHIDNRVLTPTTQVEDTIFASDLIGAHSVHDDYPNLQWDSLLTLTHTNGNDYTFFTDITGISCATYVNLVPGDAEVIYTYDSRDDYIEDEGKPVAWRYLGEDYRYVFFDIPLSAFDRTTAITVLRQAIADVTGGSTSVEDFTDLNVIPSSYALSQNYPNPFNPTTRISYSVPRRAHVTLEVYNILGQKVTTLVDESKAAGNYTISWDGSDERGGKVATGIYFYKLQAGDFIDSKKMLLLK